MLALTDHDTTAGWAEAVAALPPGLTLVRGAELSCVAETATGRVSLHLLGYLFDPAEPALAAELARLRADRDRRGAAMVARLVDLGAPVSWEQVQAIAAGGTVGRPHVGRALVDAGVVPDLASAFSRDWIGAGGRAYVPKRALEPAAAIGLVRAAGGVTVLAHPGADGRGPVVADGVVSALAAAGLDGLEVDHPDHSPAVRGRLRSLAAGLGLVVTGSSDFHGANKSVRLGENLTAAAAYEALVDRARGVAPIAA